MIRYILGVFLFSVFLYSEDISQKYTAYRYVFDEFDIDPSYIYNRDFHTFVTHNEKRMQRLYRHTTQTRKALINLLREKLLDDDLSDLFLYLSIIESGLKTDAVSSKKAAGLWQFMPQTASEYKLNVYDCIDERCDPVSATDAAIKHLRRLHTRFGKWYLAILAYNSGEGRLSRAIKKAGTDTLEILIDPQNRYLPNETIDYIRKILLLAMIGESETIRFQADSEEKGLVTVEVRGGTSLAKIAKLIDIAPQKLHSLNPAYTKGKVPPKEALYPLLIPEEKMAVFYMKYIPEEGEEIRLKPYLVSHKVCLGETLESIAKIYGTTAKEIQYANHLEEIFLEVNSTLIVPVDKEVFEQILKK